MATWYQSTKSKAPGKAQQMYNDPAFQQRAAAYQQAVAGAQYNAARNIPGYQVQPQTQADPNAVSQASQSNSLADALNQLLNPDNAPVDLQTPGGNTLSGRGRGKGAGSATLAKELQQKLQIMNLDEQKKLIDLQLQQDPQNYQLILQKLSLQEQNAQNAFGTQMRGLNSSAATSGAFTARGTQLARGDLGTQLQSRLQGVGINRQQQALNEQYNQAALQSQSTMNFWERFAQAAQAGFFSGK